CPICLGYHPYKIIECNTSILWDHSYPTVFQRINWVLFLGSGSALHVNWQCSTGCSASSHPTCHLFSGCSSLSHGVQECSQAEKI
ncbi:hypothetical protein BDN71DRAFT_1396714, partial [Pleurotus eryngii]